VTRGKEGKPVNHLFMEEGATPSSSVPEDGSACCGVIVGSVIVTPLLALLIIGIIEGLGRPLSEGTEGLIFMATLGIVTAVTIFRGVPWPRRLALATLTTALFVGLFVGYPHWPQWVRALEEFLNLVLPPGPL
jgi:hypothetical protein